MGKIKDYLIGLYDDFFNFDIPGPSNDPERNQVLYDAGFRHGLNGHVCKNDSDIPDILEQDDAAFYELINPRGCYIELYKDRKKEWRWRFYSANNKILACSGEGYKRKASMLKSLNIVREVIPFVPVENL